MVIPTLILVITWIKKNSKMPYKTVTKMVMNNLMLVKSTIVSL
jgi:hypothetical protein